MRDRSDPPGTGIPRRPLLIAGVAGLAGTALGALPGTGPAAAGDDGWLVPVETSDALPVRLGKAASVVPTRIQQDWQRHSVTAFTHVGMNTFTDREWGSGAEAETSFAPDRVFDVDQWMRVLTAAGCTQVMLTVKHHDGFTLYPSRYTNHSVVASPYWLRLGEPVPPDVRAARRRAQDRRHDDESAYWRVRDVGDTNPDGDVLGRYVAAARRAGLRIGIYLSPADGGELTDEAYDRFVAEIRAKRDAGKPLSIEEQATIDDADAGLRPQGQRRYGNGSARRARTIPTLVPDDDRAERLESGRLPRFTVTADDYNAYYLNLIYEILTEYGPIDEWWLDGANPWRDLGVTQPYDFATWFRLMRALAPDMIIDEGPAGLRWVGNEDGTAAVEQWSVVPYTADPRVHYGQDVLLGGSSAPDLGSAEQLGDAAVRYLAWMPAEADVSIRPGWFWHADEAPKSAAELTDLYRKSVGRNAVLLLNVPPGTDGRIDQRDATVLAEFGAALRDTYGDGLLSDPPDRWWSPPPGDTTGTVTVRLGRTVTADQIVLAEDIAAGQRVERYSVAVSDGTGWTTVATGRTIGYRRIVPLPAPVTATAVRVTVDAARDRPRIAVYGLYRTAGS